MPTRGLIPLTLLITAGLAHGEPPCLDPLIERVSLRLRTAPAGLRPRLAPVPDPALTSHALRLQADAGELDLDWTDAQAVEALLADTVRATRAAEPEHGADMLAVYTAGPVDRAPFYLPLANDVRGIGYGRLGLAPTETFRSAVDPRLDGVAFLGDLPTALAEPVEAERLFLHELGHRWGVYVHLADGGDALLGRNCRHWSAFVDAGDAPLEGHRWSPVAGGWRADAPQPPLRYAPLTRYLMGLIPLDEVPPIERLAVAAPPCDEPARNGEPNPRWRALGPADPPWVQTAERVAHPAAQVVAAEGPRLPAWPDAPTRWTVRLVILARPGEAIDAAGLAALRLRLTAAFMRAAGAPATGALLATGLGGVADVPAPDAGAAPDGAAEDLGGPDGALDRGPVDARPLDGTGSVDDGARLDGGRGGRGAPGGGCRGAGDAPVGWLAWLLAALGLSPRRRPGPGCAGSCRPASRAER